MKDKHLSGGIITEKCLKVKKKIGLNAIMVRFFVHFESVGNPINLTLANRVMESRNLLVDK